MKITYFSEHTPISIEIGKIYPLPEVPRNVLWKPIFHTEHNNPSKMYINFIDEDDTLWDHGSSEYLGGCGAHQIVLKNIYKYRSWISVRCYVIGEL